MVAPASAHFVASVGSPVPYLKWRGKWIRPSASITAPLKKRQRYHVNFANMDTYRKDIDERRFRKRKQATVYHNFKGDFLTAGSGAGAPDNGERGALYDSRIVSHLESRKQAYQKSAGSA
jgi:hypothetical protein